LGFGSQSHLKFLPERQTDFIFASFAEEWGWVGSVLLLGIYSLLIFYIFYYALIQKKELHHYYLVSVMTLLMGQTFINIGMNTGLMPITGVTLPFVSYGGSSLMSLGLMIGIAQSIIAQTESQQSWYLK
jgi:rod shape determining protein RodA